MKQYDITGMSCAACSARVEKAVSKVAGVDSCTVNLLTNSMGVEGSASDSDIISAVENAGYGAKLKGSEKNTAKSDNSHLSDRESPILFKRLVSSIVFLIALMYISMGHMMWGWPLPTILAENHVALGLIQLLLSAIVMVINQKFFINGFKGLAKRSPNMDTLVALGSGASFIYSTYVLFAMTDAQLRGDMTAVHHYSHEFYFESAAMILALITVGKMLEARSKGKTTNAIKSLMDLSPKTACVIRDGREETVSIESVHRGDVFVIRPGESIPADGVILEGHCSIDESALTGESIPVDKTAGDSVSAATVNRSGFVKCEATHVGEDTTLSQIIKMVSDAAATKAPIAKLADRVSGVFVPCVISIAILTFIIWTLCGATVGFSLARGISVLVISCPCALGLATPVAIMVGNGVGAKNGILFKTAASLEEAGKMKTVVFDKTGTVTCGKPGVTDIIPAQDVTTEELLSLALSLESKSEHPLALAVITECKEKGITCDEVTDFENLPGHGLAGKLRGEPLIGGNHDFVSRYATIPNDFTTRAIALSEKGKTPLYFSKGKKFLGIIAVADLIKDDSPRAISELRAMGIRTVMLTGDNERTARAVGALVGVDEVIAGVLPEGKESAIRSLQKNGKVAMVGDGINDAPALKRADVGVAIGAGTDVAIDAADVVLMNSRLSDVPAALRLSRATLRNIRENLFWAFIYNVVGIPVAAGMFINIFGWQLSPMLGAAAMSLSSFCVVTNALRLNFTDIRRGRSAENINVNTETKEINKMEITLKIEGMMCGHCEARVKKTLEAFSQVDEAAVSHADGTAIVKLNSEIDVKELVKAVEDDGYTVIE